MLLGDYVSLGTSGHGGTARKLSCGLAVGWMAGSSTGAFLSDVCGG